MKKILFYLAICVFLSGCFWINERGISGRYYNDCKEYYDASGMYHKKCDENAIEWDDMTLLKDKK